MADDVSVVHEGVEGAQGENLAVERKEQAPHPLLAHAEAASVFSAGEEGCHNRAFTARLCPAMRPGHWFCRVRGEQPLPLGSVEPGKEEHRHEDRQRAHELLPGGLLYLESLSIGTERVGIRVASEASRSRCPLSAVLSPLGSTAATPARSPTSSPGTGSA